MGDCVESRTSTQQARSPSGDPWRPASSHGGRTWALQEQDADHQAGRPAPPLPSLPPSGVSRGGVWGLNSFLPVESPHMTRASPLPPFLLSQHTRRHTPVSDCVSPGLSVGRIGSEGAPSSRAASVLSEGHPCPSYHQPLAVRLDNNCPWARLPLLHQASDRPPQVCRPQVLPKGPPVLHQALRLT